TSRRSGTILCLRATAGEHIDRALQAELVLVLGAEPDLGEIDTQSPGGGGAARIGLETGHALGLGGAAGGEIAGTRSVVRGPVVRRRWRRAGRRRWWTGIGEGLELRCQGAGVGQGRSHLWQVERACLHLLAACPIDAGARDAN